MFLNDEKNDWGQRPRHKLGENLTIRSDYEPSERVKKFWDRMTANYHAKKAINRLAKIERRIFRKKAREYSDNM